MDTNRQRLEPRYPRRLATSALRQGYASLQQSRLNNSTAVEAHQAHLQDNEQSLQSKLEQIAKEY